MVCVTNLLGGARGIVSQATGTWVGGPYIIPLINLVEIMRQSEKEAQPKTRKKAKVKAAKKKVATKKKTVKKQAAKKKVAPKKSKPK